MPQLKQSTKFKLAFVAIAAADAWLAGSSNTMAHRARVLTKPLLMPTLSASLLTNPKATDSPLRASTLVAQAGGWGGDLALMGHGTTPFAVGTGSFAVGHAAYISGFLRNRRTGAGLANTSLVKALAGIWAVSGPVMAVGAWRTDRRLGPAVLGYSAMLAGMVAAAAQLDPDLPADARRATIAGAGLFMLSDSILGTRKFLLTNAPDRLESVVMATYTGAQFLLSEGAASTQAKSGTTARSDWPRPCSSPMTSDPGRGSRRHVCVGPVSAGPVCQSSGTTMVSPT